MLIQKELRALDMLQLVFHTPRCFIDSVLLARLYTLICRPMLKCVSFNPQRIKKQSSTS